MSTGDTAVLMESGGDLSAEFCGREGIEYLPLHVIYPEKDYLDGIDIDPAMIYRRYPGEIPSTSVPSPQEIIDKLLSIKEKGFKNVIAVTISAALSSVGNAIAAVASQVPDLRVTVFDTKNISFGSGIFALWAVRQLAKGVPYEELAERMRVKRSDSRQFFYMDTLKYLRHGGRIGRVSSFVGEALHIKPIISCDPDGVYYTVAKIRGERMGKKRLLEEVCGAVGSRRCWIVIGHGGAPKEAEAMKAMLEEKLENMEYLFTKQITATLANNTGPGLLGVMAFIDP